MEDTVGSMDKVLEIPKSSDLTNADYEQSCCREGGQSLVVGFPSRRTEPTSGLEMESSEASSSPVLTSAGEAPKWASRLSSPTRQLPSGKSRVSGWAVTNGTRSMGLDDKNFTGTVTNVTSQVWCNDGKWF